MIPPAGRAVLLGLLLAGCTSSPAAPAHTIDVADPVMGHQPVGTMEIVDGPGGTVLRYVVHGLQPSSVHPLLVSDNGCGTPGVPVGIVTADGAGTTAGDLRVALPSAPAGGSGQKPGWGVSVGVGPGAAAPPELAALACAPSVAAGSSALGPVPPFSTSAPQVHISYDRTTRVMTVKVRVTGLEPGTRHPNHLHVGQCFNEGPVREVLTTLVADAVGNAEASTELPQSDGIKKGQRYVAIHHGPGLDSQAQYALLACGDVT